MLEIVATAQSWAAGFWAYVQDVWVMRVFGMAVWQLIGAVVILSIAFVLRGLLAKWIVSGLHAAAAMTSTTFDDILVRSIDKPATMVPLIVGLFIAIQLLGLSSGPDGSPTFAERLLTSLITVTIFWTLHRAVDPFKVVVAPLRKSLSSAMVDWMLMTLKVLFAFVGAAAVLEIWGIPVAPILAGLGIFGVAVALGAQDLFKNLIAGISILMERRMEPGDWVLVDGIVEGDVEKINFRSTVIRRFDKSPVYVPNSVFADNAVTNFSRMSHRRIKWMIALEYNTTTAQMRYVCDQLHAHLMDNDDFANPPVVPTFVHVDSFNDSSVDILLYCFTKTTKWGEWLAIKQELALTVKRIVEEAGADFAFPSQTSYLVDLSRAPAVEEPQAVREHNPRIWQSPNQSKAAE